MKRQNGFPGFGNLSLQELVSIMNIIIYYIYHVFVFMALFRRPILS